MLKRAGIIILILALVFGGIYAYQVTTKPARIHENIEQTFAHIGFQNLTLPEAEQYRQTLVYKGIDLDEDGFSSIETVIIKHSPFVISFSDDDATATVKGLELTGELGQDGQITIAGFSPPEALNLNFDKLPSVINLENFSLSLLSEDLGGINVSGSIQFSNHHDMLKFQGDLDAIQKQVAINAKIEGQYNQNGFVDIRIEIENGKFDLGFMQATRIAGLILANGENLANIRTVTELQTGALRIYDMPWQNASITVDTKQEHPRAIISAKSTGYEGLELGLTIPNLFDHEIFIGQIHADTLKTAFDYFNSQNISPIEDGATESLGRLKNISAKFAKKGNVKFQLQDENQNATTTGVVKNTDGVFQGEIKSTPIPLVNFSKELAGTLEIAGNFEKAEELTGSLIATLKNASLFYGFINLSDINTELDIDDIQTLSGEPVKNIKCTINDFKLDEQCSLNAKIDNGALKVSDLVTRGPGFEAFIPSADADKTLIQMRKINLRELLQLFGSKQWSGQGTLDGNLIVGMSEGKKTIKSLNLTNKGKGILKITDPAFFDMIGMEDLEKETMRLAFENFHFDLLEIKAEGTLPDQVKISVFGKGNNPQLMQGRPFSLDFKVTPDFTPILSEITKER